MTLETEAGAPSCRGVPRMGWQTPPWSISILFSPQMCGLKEQAKWQPAELEARLSCDLLSGSCAGATVLWSAQLPGSPLVTRGGRALSLVPLDLAHCKKCLEEL